MPQALTPLLDADAVNRLLTGAYPQLNEGRPAYRVVDIHPGGCLVRLEADERHLRPGNTVSGPSLFTLADIGGYACALSHAGPDPLSVTTDLTIHFMRKAEAGIVDGHCRILKLGRSLMVFDVDLRAGPGKIRVAHACGTYSLAPGRAAVGSENNGSTLPQN